MINLLSERLLFRALRPVSMAPLAGFRVLFGALVFGATVRFWAHGWIEEFYVRPRFFFSYYGFEWVQPLPAPWLYGVFGLLAISALGVAMGAWYRASAVLLLLTFGYVELLDKTNYLNHYYYVTLAAALLCLLPAHRAWSVDAWRSSPLPSQGKRIKTRRQRSQLTWLLLRDFLTRGASPEGTPFGSSPKTRNGDPVGGTPAAESATPTGSQVAECNPVCYRTVSPLGTHFDAFTLPLPPSEGGGSKQSRSPSFGSGGGWESGTVPAWMLWAVKAQIGSVYFFGGIAKLKADWLLEAQPLRIWLAANAALPIVGPLLEQAWVAFVVAWIACLFDLTVPFLLWRRRTRPWAYAVAVVFHLLTARLFYIGIFPWAMLLSTLVFFPARYHARALGWLFGWVRVGGPVPGPPLATAARGRAWDRPANGALYLVGALFLLQLALPFRYLLYPGNVLWTEQGYRYSWNIMLIEKAGTVDFHLRDPRTGAHWTVDPRRYLTRQQARMLSTQPDMLVQFAHFLAAEEGRGRPYPLEVRAEAYATLNGRPSQLLVDSAVNLARETDSFAPKPWILPLRDVRASTPASTAVVRAVFSH